MSPERLQLNQDTDPKGACAGERFASTVADRLGRPSDVFSLGVCVAEMHGHFGTAMERAAVLSELKASAAQPNASLVPGRSSATIPASLASKPFPPRALSVEGHAILPKECKEAESLAMRMLAFCAGERPSLDFVIREAERLATRSCDGPL